jgi:hypothetical protein
MKMEDPLMAGRDPTGPTEPLFLATLQTLCGVKEQACKSDMATSTKWPARTLAIALTMAAHYLADGIGLRCICLRRTHQIPKLGLPLQFWFWGILDSSLSKEGRSTYG